jgi:hypothetical protein
VPRGREVGSKSGRQIHRQGGGRSTRNMAADPHAALDSTARARMRTALGPALPRHAEVAVKAALEDTRVVLVNGARQSGKKHLGSTRCKGPRC